MTPKEQVKRLQIYLEKCERDAKGATDPHKKAFFEREIVKTKRSIAKYQE